MTETSQTWIEYFEDQRSNGKSAYNQFIELGFDHKEAFAMVIIARMCNTLDHIEEILEAKQEDWNE